MSYNEGYLEIHPSLNPVFFRSWSPKTAKSRVVCLPGTGGSSADFERFGRSMQTGSCEVLAVDLPASGNSLPQTGVERQKQLSLQLMIVNQLLTKDGLPAALISSSGRAILGFWYAYQTRANNKKPLLPLIFLEPAFRFDASTKAYIESCLTFFNQGYKTLDQAVAAWDACELRKIKFDSDDDKKAYISKHLRPDGRLLKPIASEARKAQVMSTRTFDLLADKEPIQNPTLMLWGSESKALEQFGAEVRRVFPEHQSKTIRGSGHPLTLYRESEITEVKKFLKANKIG